MAVIDKRWREGDPSPRPIWIKRGANTGGSDTKGPSGRKLKPAAKLHRALGELAISYGVYCGQKRIPGAGPNNGPKLERRVITIRSGLDRIALEGWDNGKL